MTPQHGDFCVSDVGAGGFMQCHADRPRHTTDVLTVRRLSIEDAARLPRLVFPTEAPLFSPRQTCRRRNILVSRFHRDRADRARVLGVSVSTHLIGPKGIGEIGIVGGAAAIANAVFHATGKRVRDLPIQPDKLI